MFLKVVFTKRVNNYLTITSDWDSKGEGGMITTDIGPTVLQNGPLEEKKLAKKGEIEGRIVTSRRFVKVLYFFFFSFFLFFFIFVLGLSFFQPGQPLVNLNKTNFSHWLIFIKQTSVMG